VVTRVLWHLSQHFLSPEQLQLGTHTIEPEVPVDDRDPFGCEETERGIAKLIVVNRPAGWVVSKFGSELREQLFDLVKRRVGEGVVPIFKLVQRILREQMTFFQRGPGHTYVRFRAERGNAEPVLRIAIQEPPPDRVHASHYYDVFGFAPESNRTWFELNNDYTLGVDKWNRHKQIRSIRLDILSKIRSVGPILQLLPGLLEDLDRYLRALDSEKSYEEQLREDVKDCPYLNTPFGVMPNSYYTPPPVFASRKKMEHQNGIFITYKNV